MMQKSTCGYDLEWSPLLQVSDMSQPQPMDATYSQPPEGLGISLDPESPSEYLRSIGALAEEHAMDHAANQDVPVSTNVAVNDSNFNNSTAKHGHPDNPPDIQSSDNALWACPFAKKNPVLHNDCVGKPMKTIGGVKRHLSYFHLKPAVCPICSIEFQRDDEFLEHIRERRCSERPGVIVEGVTPDQKRLIRDSPRAGLPKSEQWYAIYRILFPSQPQPKSPFFEIAMSDDIKSLHKFMAAKGYGIMKRKALENMPQVFVPHQTELFDFLHMLYEHTMKGIIE